MAGVGAHVLIPGTFQPHPVFRPWALYSKIRMLLFSASMLCPVLSLYGLWIAGVFLLIYRDNLKISSSNGFVRFGLMMSSVGDHFKEVSVVH